MRSGFVIVIFEKKKKRHGENQQKQKQKNYKIPITREGKGIYLTLLINYCENNLNTIHLINKSEAQSSRKWRFSFLILISSS